MLRRLSLIDELKKGGYEASLITTYNAYLPFYEEVVLRRLVSAGVRHNVLMMDAQQYATSILNHPPRSAGRLYTLLPVAVSGAFHPKLILLVGKKKALVAIGSHNMTLAGFGFNRELTNIVRIDGIHDPAGLTVASQVWEAIEGWSELASRRLPNHLVKMIRRIRDFGPTGFGLTGEQSGEVRVLAGGQGRESLWSQLQRSVRGRVTKVAIAGAYFDGELRFLQRVHDDLQPERMVIGIDPETVNIQRAENDIPGVEFMRADKLGLDMENGGKGAGYLHAKGIFVQSDQGGEIFTSGSANPSAPAWLARPTFGNVELMLMRFGKDAVVAAEQTGFASIFHMDPLGPSDWATIEANRAPEGAEAEHTSKVVTGVGLVEEDSVVFGKSLIDPALKPTFLLLDADRREIRRLGDLRAKDGNYVLKIPSGDLISAVWLRASVNGEPKLELLLHHARVVEEQARTGVQRRFREALRSLHTDAPNIGLLIECIDKIVFADELTVERTISKWQPVEVTSDAETTDEGSLSIDVSEVKSRKAKQRLKHSSDFAYLLDALIYRLRVQNDRPIEELDRHGRNEEEQIGADDDEDTETARALAEQHDELLRLCHSKVRTIVNRMVVQFHAYSEGRQSLEQVIVRLLAVLAVLRELRAFDGRAMWVAKGKTTVPREQREKLFEGAMHTLFERKESLLHLESLSELADSDDVGRLKGLLIWLAWEYGLAVNLKRPFMETKEQLEARLRGNAMMLALAQAIRSDEIAIDEARQSIRTQTSSELEWLEELIKLAGECGALKDGLVNLQPGSAAQPGDIAVHTSIENWDLRVVMSRDDEYVSLVSLDRDKGKISYMHENLGVTKLTGFGGSH
ncbi:MAG: hypothetical protein OXK81_14160 [Chloroflexota bacterium]|nr:hypothetical protein [Chloroflexota bacterium]